MRGVLTFVLAGGRGERLNPLTKDRAKPAVPFGGIYRIIDFTLSNCVNSGLRRIYVLTQYKSFSLQKHLLAGWNIVSSQLGEFIDVIPAQQRIGDEWYRGTADAIYQNLYAIQDWDPELIMILAGDHVYKMNYQKMIHYHQEKNADLTVACVPMPAKTSTDFGVIEVDADNKVLGFQEKPKDPKVIPHKPDQIFASMGIYLFSREALTKELEIDARSDSNHDFGKNIIPQMIEHGKNVYVHNFTNKAGDPLYWRDIGTRDAYYEANMDLLREKSPINLYERTWPVRTYHSQYPPVKLVHTSKHEAKVHNSMLSGGCIIEGAVVENSVLSPNVYVEEGAQIKNSVIMESVVVGKNAKIRNAIIDKEVEVPAKATVGFDAKKDQEQFVLTTSGVTIVPKKSPVSKG